MQELLRIKVVLIVISFFSSANVLADYKSDTDINDHYRNATVLIKHEMYEEAIESLQRANEAEPNNADIQNLLGYTHRQIGKYRQAYRYYQAALKLDPQHRGAHHYLGELYLQTHELKQAKRQLTTLAEICKSRCKEYKKLRKAIAKY